MYERYVIIFVRKIRNNKKGMLNEGINNTRTDTPSDNLEAER